MDERGVYVYGIIRADHGLSPACRGVGSPPARVRTVRTETLAAVVSEAPESLLARRRDLLAHQETLLTMAETGPVLPMRFGVVSPDEAAVVDQLVAREAEYAATLARLDGRLEMNLKVFPVEDALPDLVRADPAVSRLHAASRSRPGYETSVRLGEAIAAGLHRRAAQAAARTVSDLAPLAEAAAEGPDVAGCVANVSFLVARTRIDRFRTAVADCAAGLGRRAELRLTGPLPCFSFVPAARPEPPVAARRS
ncbi:GvpL/GvpF family gas vesicle protein [Streptomyces sp. NBC_01803]|uniref:GvpL/GvpF family gas vesicle protein n=1 Tax=Streptomyces sp. NBC_01803 TaxID=2975946 RepID=UPI002DDBD980|nr:GvpL/GvpF family gas vesicle protein [Streptomyces sp. NBC_01803]WSA44166.1 GvpL/GvpF family gas vesicle protein [Streptomyces sp. NBC_01803]